MPKGFFTELLPQIKQNSPYPMSCYDVKSGILLERILDFHVRPIGNRILDPTCGTKHIWEGFIDTTYDIVYSDIIDYGHNIVSDLNDLQFDKLFHGIVFDPPYLFGIKNSKDIREDEYGGYAQTYDDLVALMTKARDKLFTLLVNKGILILKCQDMFHLQTRKFYALHVDWINLYSKLFNLKDIFINRYHHISPTAFQVKNRPCNVINHSYYIIFQKLGRE